MAKVMSQLEEGILMGMGWMLAEACIMVEQGIDIRKQDCGQYVKRGLRDLLTQVQTGGD